MGRYKLLFEISMLNLIFIVLAGGVSVALVLGSFMYWDGPKFTIAAANSTLAMACPIYSMGFCGQIVRTMDSSRKESLSYGYNSNLLSMSLMERYFFLLLSALVMCVILVLMSLPVELVGSILTASNSPEKQIVVGGMIRYFAENGIFPLILAEVSVALCAGTLFRTTWCVMLADIVVIVICSFINAFYFAFDKPMSLSLSGCGVCLIVAVVCLVSGYQIFKRW